MYLIEGLKYLPNTEAEGSCPRGGYLYPGSSEPEIMQCWRNVNTVAGQLGSSMNFLQGTVALLTSL